MNDCVKYGVNTTFESISQEQKNISANCNAICFYNESTNAADAVKLKCGINEMVLEAGMESPTFGVALAEYWCTMDFQISKVGGGIVNILIVRTTINPIN